MRHPLALATLCAAALLGLIAPALAGRTKTSIVIGKIEVASGSGSTSASRIRVSGRLRHPPKHARVVLQLGPANWKTVARARPGRHHRFTLTWQVPAGTEGQQFLRVRAFRRRRRLATSKTLSATLPTKSTTQCEPPPSPKILPPGDGTITGGLYIEGGAYGIERHCSPSDYTVTLRDSTGAVVATEDVSGGHSYGFVVSAGDYSLFAPPRCTGSAHVVAGAQTHADVTCLVP